MTALPDFEKLGRFYLGRRAGAGDLVLYDSRDLTTHAVCVGMTGSGKTGLCAVLLEEAAIDGIPAIAIDPKGDLANLALAFPELRPEDFAPWLDAREAERAGRSRDEHAAALAARWREGLAGSGQSAERIARFKDAVELRVLTPGSREGRPVSVLGSLSAPSVGDHGDRLAATAGALLSLVGIDADPLQSREHILLSHLFDAAWQAGKSLTLVDLVRLVQRPEIDRIGALDLESFFPARDRAALAMRLNNLVASPRFSAWLTGEPLEIESLLYDPHGKPRLTILSIAHLDDAERMFFVTLLLGEVLSWMRKQPGSESLRAILYMDEVFGFFPPVANPPSKAPMLTLLKQARAFGLGVVLATQNPVDLDYKGLSNCGTWLVGRLRTDRDLDRVATGLESAGSRTDPAELRKTIAGLETRRFLMHDVHEEADVVLETRWALSYLRGPLTLVEIARLGERKEETAAPVAGGAEIRPALSVPEGFLTPAAPSEAPPSYEPRFGATVRLHYVHAKSGLDVWFDRWLLAPLSGGILSLFPGHALPIAHAPIEGARFLPLPGGDVADLLKKRAASVKNEIERTAALAIGYAPALGEWSKPGETPAAFRARMEILGREKRDRELDALRAKHEKAIERIRSKVERAESKLASERAQYESKKVDTTISVGSTVLGVLFGRRGLGGATTAARGAARIAREHDDVQRAERGVKEAQAELAEIEREVEQGLEAARAVPIQVEIEEVAVAPKRADLAIENATLVWAPVA
jgi:DNA helicase HerA-like ATPase